ncbi:MAG TPA: DegT/DnrJ/EryC1/StrS family aminotransferase [Planctomycetota bacterium]|nr:DegT/DnrJ/EryC1/StrS family aminotransferase [Planctomycetota bacterium]
MNRKTPPHPLALHGGPKSAPGPFRPYNPIGAAELRSAHHVIKSGILSQYIGAWHDDFYGGPKVLEFERRCQDFFGVKHAVTVNSWTSGLIAAVGAIGIEPGDEVITSPWTMCATATAIVHWNAIPVFADIEARTFCLDPKSVEANITPHTRAILAVDIFGHSADMAALRAIARKHGLRLISDTAQAPGARIGTKYAGTLADIGGYSLNYHKHIHTGEGGIIVTDDDDLAERAQLIRNHAEAVVGGKGVTNLRNMIGYNFRLGEIECAIGIEQLRKLKALVKSRQKAAERLSKGLEGLQGLRTPVVSEGCTHSYYVYPLLVDVQAIGVGRTVLIDALQAEGVPGLAAGYQNIHLLPMYQQKLAFGSSGFPWTSGICRREVDYRKGICPTAERLHDSEFLGLAICKYDFPASDIDVIAAAFRKVWANLDALKAQPRSRRT